MFSAVKEKPSTILIKSTSEKLFNAIRSSDFASQTNAIFNWGRCFLLELEENEVNEETKIQKHNLIYVAIITIAMAMEEQQYKSGKYAMNFQSLLENCKIKAVSLYPGDKLAEIDIIRQFVFAVGNKVLVEKTLPAPTPKETIFAKHKFEFDEILGKENSVGLSRLPGLTGS